MFIFLLIICINIFLRDIKNIIKILLLEGLKIIAENFKHVLTNYLQVYEEPLKGHPFYSFVKNDLGKPFEELIDNDKYVVSGSTAEGRWALVPSLRISNKDITTSSQNGYYIVYLFKEDMTGVYLSLNFGARGFHEKYGKNNLKHAANNFRKILQEEFEEITNYTPMDLSHRPNKKKGVNSKKYEDGDIFNIYYPLEGLNSDDKIINDFNLFLRMYDYIYEKRGTTIFNAEELSNINNVPARSQEPPVEQSDKKFKDYLKEQKFFFDKKTIENYLLSLKVKPFIILTGNSGTGKTKLSWLFADYLNEKITYKFNNNAIVPVGANWTENRNIVGYYNVLTKSYQHTQSLDLLLDAGNDEYNPYFLILDEMNLSHVERYFSDFLSAMESKEAIPLHKDSDKLEDEKKVPENLEIPPNIFIVGTVNVDETTYMFSPKVLDRSNVLEFKTFESISIEDYINNSSKSIEFGENVDIDYLENPLSDLNLRDNILSKIHEGFDNAKYEITLTTESDGETENKIIDKGNVLEELTSELTEFNEILKDSGFEFGYRTVNEILSFMYVAWKYEREETEFNNWKRYFDAQILQKILPKLHGSQLVLGDTLDKLLAHCLGSDTINENPKLSDIREATPYPDSAKKLIQMKNTLEKQRYVSFIN